MSSIPRFADRKVLVTGGLGFIGSNLVHRLVDAGARVTIVDSLIPEFGGNLANVAEVRDRVTLVMSDLRDPLVCDEVVPGQDYIFHLAGQVSHGDSMRDPLFDLAVNAVATVNVLEACRRHKSPARLVYASTRQVYGRPQQLPVTEDHPLTPVDVNGINKLAAEHYHLLYHHTYGIPSTVLRLTNTYGPRQQIRNNRQGFCGIFIRQALLGETIRLFGGGGQLRDFNYIDDVVEAIVRAALVESCYGRAFNLGANRPYSLIEYVELLGRDCQFKVEKIPFPADKKLIDIGDYYGDFQRFQQATGWAPQVDLPEGLERSIAFYRQHKEVYWQ